MNQPNKGYRALPAKIFHPMKYRQISDEEFKNTGKEKMDSAKSVCPGHTSTVVYFVDNKKTRYYITQINLTDQSYYLETPCTFTPTFGLDSVDGSFAQDAEEYIIEQQLGIVSERLKFLFEDKGEITAAEYAKKIGFPFAVVDIGQISKEQKDREQSIFIPRPKNKNWWQFWK